MPGPLTLKDISFSYEDGEDSVITSFNASFSKGWTALIGANGCGKSTLLQIIAGKLKPSSGTIYGIPETTYLCLQSASTPPAELEDLLNAYDPEAVYVKTLFELHDGIECSWDALSEGFKKRWQIACALWKKPDLLLLDEPTNHLDIVQRKVIINALSTFAGVGILVSHDRETLEQLCSKCIFFVEKCVFSFNASFSEAQENLNNDLEALATQKDLLKKEISRLSVEVNRVSEVNRSSKKRTSKRNFSKNDHDAKEKINRVRLTGKDASLGAKQKQLAQRVEDLRKNRESIINFKDYSDSIFFENEESSKKGVVFSHRKSQVRLPNGKKLLLPELAVKYGEKIGLMGDNGIGKSSLLRYFKDGNFFPPKHLYLKQELSHTEIAELRKNFEELQNKDQARVLQIVARLGSSAKQILYSESWSAGEIRKIAIALGVINHSDFLVLDEPTNHLDLPSILKLESALSEGPVTLLVVSHDKVFLGNVCDRIFLFTKDNSQDTMLVEV